MAFGYRFGSKQIFAHCYSFIKNRLLCFQTAFYFGQRKS
ncbi:hypothetical protein [Neisseria meningitidis serogroup B]|uniref:Uncharacterized protein n=1 Tax=Neisseria meningitidis serogroup B TaxID=491 RepID=A0A0H5QBF8_NEIMI|nr:hypothetical protein [Neisseria meningitidis serogroup B]